MIRGSNKKRGWDMVTRVSEGNKFSMITNSLSNVENKYNDIMEKMTTEKKINRPSDDPIGISKVLDHRSTISSIGQYQTNIDDANGWLSLSETKLSSIGDLITQASQIAISQASATASSDTRKISADSVSQMIEQALSLANSKDGDSYLFGGSRTDTQPFSSVYASASIGSVLKASASNSSGAATSGGTYTGTVNKTYAVKIINGGALATSTYQISADGGKTWGATQANISAPITIGDGITMTFSGAPDAGDLYTVLGSAAGYYRGNNDKMNVEIGKGNNFSYNITGAQALTTQAGGMADLFQHLNDLQTALQNNDASGISAQIDNLKNAQTQVTQFQSNCGTKINTLDTAKSNNDSMNLQITSMMSDTEDADITQLSIAYQSQQIALQASYNMAAQISKNTIMNFLK
jgi:flagellar hook-associated protein 3 FlgL